MDNPCRLSKISLLFPVSLLLFVAHSSAQIDRESPVTKAFISSRKALAARDHETYWRYIDQLTKKEKFDDEIKNVQQFMAGLKDQSHQRSELKGVRMVTPRRAWVDSEHPRFPAHKGFYLVQEDGEWKVAEFKLYLVRVKRDLAYIRGLVEKYFADNKKLPESLAELVPAYAEVIPADPFNDAADSYAYSPGAGSFKIYSFGPDSADNSGLVEHDPESHPVSEGDIVLEVKLPEVNPAPETGK